MSFSMLFFVIGALLNQALCHPGFAQPRDSAAEDKDVAVIEQGPFVAGVYRNGSHVCSAVIIHEQYVLTAANCIKPNYQYQVTVGTEFVYKNEGELFEIEEINVHPNFDEETYDYDICVIKLKEPLEFGSKVAKIDIPYFDLSIYEGSKLTITGWYYQACNSTATKPPRFLQKQLPIFGNEECVSLCANTPFVLTRMVCTNYLDHAPSSLDSGNPLTYNGQLIGITSIDYGCNREVALYTNVTSHIGWILQTIYHY